MRTRIDDLLEQLASILLTIAVVTGAGFSISLSNTVGEPWWSGMLISMVAVTGFVVVQVIQGLLLRQKHRLRPPRKRRALHHSTNPRVPVLRLRYHCTSYQNSRQQIATTAYRISTLSPRTEAHSHLKISTRPGAY
jgi:hypothetical protein